MFCSQLQWQSDLISLQLMGIIVFRVNCRMKLKKKGKYLSVRNKGEIIALCNCIMMKTEEVKFVCIILPLPRLACCYGCVSAHAFVGETANTIFLSTNICLQLVQSELPGKPLYHVFFVSYSRKLPCSFQANSSSTGKLHIFQLLTLPFPGYGYVNYSIVRSRYG